MLHVDSNWTSCNDLPHGPRVLPFSYMLVPIPSFSVLTKDRGFHDKDSKTIRHRQTKLPSPSPVPCSCSSLRKGPEPAALRAVMLLCHLSLMFRLLHGLFPTSPSPCGQHPRAQSAQRQAQGPALSLFRAPHAAVCSGLFCRLPNMSLGLGEKKQGNRNHKASFIPELD